MKKIILVGVVLSLFALGIIKISQQNEVDTISNSQPSPIDQFSQESVLSPETSNKDLIIGKWLYSGSTKFRLEVEYFEDKTYVEKTTADLDFLNKIENGEYIILSDGRLKKTFERCTQKGIASECKQLVHVNKISFPDPDTLQVEYEIDATIETFTRVY